MIIITEEKNKEIPEHCIRVQLKELIISSILLNESIRTRKKLGIEENSNSEFNIEILERQLFFVRERIEYFIKELQKRRKKD